MVTHRNERSLRLALTSGCLGGVFTTLLFQPLDVLKTRLQAEILSGRSSPGLIHLLKSVFYTNTAVTQTPSIRKGLANFWTGTVPSLWRCVPGVGGYFLCLTALERSTSRYKPDHTQTNARFVDPLYTFLTGLTARSTIAFLLNPFMVAKTQAESGRFSDRSMWTALRRVHNGSGWRGLYSGVVATVLRDGPYSGLYFTAYSGFKKLFYFASPCQTDCSYASSVLFVSVCAAMSAFVATGITQPADVLRAQRQLMLSRLPVVSKSDPRPQRIRWRDVFAGVYRVDGLIGLWRGFLFRLLRRTGVAVISWTLYEHLT